jgi:hypothetical protein
VTLFTLVYSFAPIGADYASYFNLWNSVALDTLSRDDIPQMWMYKKTIELFTPYMGYGDFRILVYAFSIFVCLLLVRGIGKKVYIVPSILMLLLFSVGLDRQMIALSLLLLSSLLFLDGVNKPGFTGKLYYASAFMIGSFAVFFHQPSVIGFLFLCLTESKFRSVDRLSASIFICLAGVTFLFFFSDILDMVYGIYDHYASVLKPDFFLSWGNVLKLSIASLLVGHCSRSNVTTQYRFVLISFFCVTLFIQIAYKNVVRIEMYALFYPLVHIARKFPLRTVFLDIIFVVLLVWIPIKVGTWNLFWTLTPALFVDFMTFPFY